MGTSGGGGAGGGDGAGDGGGDGGCCGPGGGGGECGRGGGVGGSGQGWIGLSRYIMRLRPLTLVPYAIEKVNRKMLTSLAMTTPVRSAISWVMCLGSLGLSFPVPWVVEQYSTVSTRSCPWWCCV